MILSRLGFSEEPFAADANVKFFYSTPNSRDLFNSLTLAILARRSVIVLLGEPGCGKTSLARKLMAHIEADGSVALWTTAAAQMSVEDLIADAGRAFVLDGQRPASEADLQGLIDRIEGQLERVGTGVLFIDDADALEPEVLSDLVELATTATDTGRFLQVMLIGSSELERKLATPPLDRAVQSVGVTHRLQRLREPDVAAFIAHRLRVAGGRESLFEPEAAAAVARLSKGNPRLATQIAGDALLMAAMEDEKTVNAAMIEEAASGRGLVSPAAIDREPIGPPAAIDREPTGPRTYPRREPEARPTPPHPAATAPAEATHPAADPLLSSIHPFADRIMLAQRPLLMREDEAFGPPRRPVARAMVWAACLLLLVLAGLGGGLALSPNHSLERVYAEVAQMTSTWPLVGKREAASRIDTTAALPAPSPTPTAPPAPSARSAAEPPPPPPPPPPAPELSATPPSTLAEPSIANLEPPAPPASVAPTSPAAEAAPTAPTAGAASPAPPAADEAPTPATAPQPAVAAAVPPPPPVPSSPPASKRTASAPPPAATAGETPPDSLAGWQATVARLLTTPEEATAEEDRPVRALVARADRELTQKRLTSPDGDSAYGTYKKLLEQAPDDPATPSLLQAITHTYVRWAEASEGRQDWEGARHFYERALTLDRDRAIQGLLDGLPARRDVAAVGSGGTVLVPPPGAAPVPSPPARVNQGALRSANGAATPYGAAAPPAAPPPMSAASTASAGAPPNKQAVLDALRRPERLGSVMASIPNLDQPLYDGRTLLMLAAESGSEEATRLILEANAHPGAAGASGDTALTSAARSGYTSIVRMLLDAGAPVNTANAEGETALMAAARRGNIDTARALIDHGAGVNLVSNRGETALMLAAQNGWTAIAQLLLSRGATPRAAVHDAAAFKVSAPAEVGQAP